MNLLLKNGNIDVLIDNGLIGAVGSGLESENARIIDCTGLTVIPGIFDMHVHLRDPGQTHKEDIFSGCEAAATGGVTAVMCMPNTTPALDNLDLLNNFLTRCADENVKTRVYPCAAITKGLKSLEITDFAELKKAGAVAVSDDGMPVSDTRIMSEALKLAAENKLAIISHCEYNGVDSRLSENLITARELCLAERFNVPVHIAHVSTKEAVEYIEIAKSRGIKVTCEATPHHFTLDNSVLEKEDADYKMNPPLREKDDIAAVIKGLQNGVIDCIASDHAPHTPDEKAAFTNAPNGVLGLETILAVTLTRLFHTGLLPLERVIELLCVNPRQILGISGGVLQAGSIADIAAIDLNEEWVVELDKLCSKSKNTCFKGMKLKGKNKLTIVNGRIVYNGI
ncbi:MAG: dihydroorotase [Oscillospiraceae bacterium]|nr:dihydroorotase [Oscillospiraceae bacterium]